MAKKCAACGAPLDGFFAKISSLAGVKPSEKNPDYCNKCVHKIPKDAPMAEKKSVEEPKDLYEAAEAPKEAEPAKAPVVEEVPAEEALVATELVKEETSAPAEASPIVEEAIPSQEEAIDPFDEVDKKAQ